MELYIKKKKKMQLLKLLSLPNNINSSTMMEDENYNKDKDALSCVCLTLGEP